DKKAIFLVAWHNDAGVLSYKLHVLNLKDALDRTPPAVIGVASNDASNPCHNNSQFNPCVHKQRAGLLLANGVLYIAFGGDGDRGALFAFGFGATPVIPFISSPNRTSQAWSSP